MEIYPIENTLQAKSDEHSDDEELDDEEADIDHDVALGRTTKELLLRLRNQVPSKAVNTPKAGRRPSLGEDIFS